MDNLLLKNFKNTVAVFCTTIFFAVFFLFLGVRFAGGQTGQILSISSNLDTGFTLQGPATFTKANATFWEFGAESTGGYAWQIDNVPPGTYEVTFDAIQEYQGNIKQTVKVPPSMSVGFSVRYDPTRIEVTPRFDTSDTREISFTIKGPQTYFGKGKSGMRWKMEKVPHGTYSVIYDPIPGYVTPPTETKTVQGEQSFGIARFGGWFFEEKQQTAPVLPPPSKPAPVPIPTQAPTPEKAITPVTREHPKEITPSSGSVSEQKSINGALPQQLSPGSQRNFFFRLWEGISSFFRRLF